MSRNPYESSTSAHMTTRTSPTRWMIVTGSILLALALCCYLATVLMMMLSFNTLSTPTSTVQVSDLAGRISTAMVSSFAGIPLMLTGLVFIIFGFIRRQPVVSA